MSAIRFLRVPEWMFVLDELLAGARPDSTPSWAEPVNMECLEIPQGEVAKLFHSDS